MSWHEKIFGAVMQGVFLGAFLWAVAGGFFGLYFRDDFSLLGQHGVYRAGHADVDMPY